MCNNKYNWGIEVSPILFTQLFGVTQASCYFKMENLNLIWGTWYWCNYFVSVLFPPIFLGFINIILLKKLINYSKERKQITCQSTSAKALDAAQVKSVIDLIFLSTINLIFSIPIGYWGYLYYLEGRHSIFRTFSHFYFYSFSK